MKYLLKKLSKSKIKFDFLKLYMSSASTKYKHNQITCLRFFTICGSFELID